MMIKSKKKNPFAVTGYEGPGSFCDREKDIEWMTEQYRGDLNMVIYSWRRMGKTALIRHFFYKVQKQDGAKCLYVDLLGTTNMSAAIKAISQAVLDDLGPVREGFSGTIRKLLGQIGASVAFDSASGVPSIEFSMVNPPQAEYSLRALGRFLREQKRKVVLALDEFQQIVFYEEKGAEAIFRAFAQEFPEIRMIFSGSHRHMMVSMFSESKRPFYRSAQMLKLEAIPRGTYSRFIRNKFKRSGKTIEADQIEEILKWSGDQTYYTQLVCNKLWYRTDQVRDADVRKVFSDIIEQEKPLFGQIRLLLTSSQWQLLRAIAKDEKVENPHSKKFIKKFDLGAASSVNTSLKSLLDKELIVQEEPYYRLHDMLMMRWIQQDM